MTFFRGNLALVSLWLMCCLFAWSQVTRTLATTPGANFDEFLQAGPALDFVRDNWQATHTPDTKAVSLFGRPFPMLTASYMGALKAELLIPAVAMYGNRVQVIRDATLCFALLGMGLTMLWVRRLWGMETAALAGICLALDPTFVWVSTHDWGAFTAGFLARTLGLFAITRGWQQRNNQRFNLWLAIGGLGFGLAMLNKIDAVSFVLGTSLGLVVFGKAIVTELRQRGWKMLVGPALGFAIGLSWFWPRVFQLVFAANRQASGGTQQFATKLETLWAMLQGSYFDRLMRVGGMFDQMFVDPDPVPRLRGFCVLASIAILLYAIAKSWPSLRARRDAYVMLSWAIVTAIIFLMPEAFRIHHAMNVFPLPHVAIAIAARRLGMAWRGDEDEAGATVATLNAAAQLSRGSATNRWLARLTQLAAIVLILLLTGEGFKSTQETQQWLLGSGGTGLWSGRIDNLLTDLRSAREEASAQGQPLPVVVSLDWGFHEQLVFLDPHGTYIDPVWSIGKALASEQDVSLPGSQQYVYLVHPNTYSVFGFANGLIDIAQQIQDASSGEDSVVEVVPYRDQLGGLDFAAVRIRRDHVLKFSAEQGVTLELAREQQ